MTSRESSKRSDSHGNQGGGKNVGGEFGGFLFAADHPVLANMNYATPCEQVLLDSLAKGDPSISYPMRVLRGDVIPHVLARRLKHVKIPTRDAAQKSYSHSQTSQIDKRAFATVVGDVAARNCVPTPMLVEGFEVIMEGACGGAYVHLDGRTKFARWLTSSGRAPRSTGPGVMIHAEVKNQSMEREKAYSDAFGNVPILFLYAGCHAPEPRPRSNR
jgi:hypothetical protein